MSKICFISYEIAPTTKGGAGALIANIARVLTDQGHEVILLLDLPRPEYERFQWHDRLEFSGYGSITAYHVEEMSQDIPYQRVNFNTEFEWRSYRFYWVLRKLVQLECPDIIEFFDYAGVGYYSIKAKIAGEAFSESWLTIRVHTTIEAIDLHDPTDYDLEKLIVYALERYSLQAAEVVFLPSKSIYDHVIQPIYQEKWLGEIAQSPPPLLIFPQYQPEGDANGILFYGRLDQLKGADTFIDAAVLVLSELASPDIRFILAGGVLNIAPNSFLSYKEQLIKRIPPNFMEYFEFPGVLSKKDLEELLPKIQFAVFPNRLESYGYAAHELYAAGVPLIVNDIPAFFDIFMDGKNALFFNGSRTDLAQKMKILSRNKGLQKRLQKTQLSLISNTPDAYNLSQSVSWINKSKQKIYQHSTRIIILDEQNDKVSVERTLRGITKSRDVFILSTKPFGDTYPILFLGKFYYSYSWTGDSLSLPELTTLESMLILRAGDVIDHDFVEKANKILITHKEISFVASWRVIKKDSERVIDTFPIDSALEMLPFQHNYLPTRIVMRTQHGVNLADLFDSRMQQLGEIHYLWHTLHKFGIGIMLSDQFIEINDTGDLFKWDSKLLNFLIMNAGSRIQKRLAPFLLSRYMDPEMRLYLELADLDIRLLLKNMAKPPLRNLLSLKRNFSTLFKRYLG